MRLPELDEGRIRNYQLLKKVFLTELYCTAWTKTAITYVFDLIDSEVLYENHSKEK